MAHRINFITKSCAPNRCPPCACGHCAVPAGSVIENTFHAGFNGTLAPMIVTQQQTQGSGIAQITQGPTGVQLFTNAIGTNTAGRITLRSATNDVVQADQDFCMCGSLRIDQNVRVGQVGAHVFSVRLVGNATFALNLTGNPGTWTGVANANNGEFSAIPLGPFVAGEQTTFRICSHRTGPDSAVVTLERTGSVSGTFSGTYTFVTAYPAGPFALEVNQQSTRPGAGVGQSTISSFIDDICVNAGSQQTCECCPPMPEVESVFLYYDDQVGNILGPPYFVPPDTGYVYTVTLVAPATEQIVGFIRIPGGIELPYIIEVGQTSFKGEAIAGFQGEGFDVEVVRNCGGSSSSQTVAVLGPQQITICKNAGSPDPTPGTYTVGVTSNPSLGTFPITPGECIVSAPVQQFIPGSGLTAVISEMMPGVPTDIVALSIDVTPPTSATVVTTVGLGTQNPSIVLEALGGPVTVTFNNGRRVSGNLLGQSTFTGSASLVCNSTVCATGGLKRYFPIPFTVPATVTTATVILSLCAADFGLAAFDSTLFMYADPFTPANPCDASFLQKCDDFCGLASRIIRTGVLPGNYVAVVSEFSLSFASRPFILSIQVLAE